MKAFATLHMYVVTNTRVTNQRRCNTCSSYLYESISTFETGIFNKVRQLQGQLMPQPGNGTGVYQFESAAHLNYNSTKSFLNTLQFVECFKVIPDTFDYHNSFGIYPNQ